MPNVKKTQGRKQLVLRKRNDGLTNKTELRKNNLDTLKRSPERTTNTTSYYSPNPQENTQKDILELTPDRWASNGWKYRINDIRKCNYFHHPHKSNYLGDTSYQFLHESPELKQVFANVDNM